MTQSAELGAGSGFTFENFVGARYLAALLTETGAPGSAGAVVGVALQQRENGEPLDDVIVDFCWPNGTSARVSLQCKTSITISDAAANTDFREIVRDSVKTLQKPGFRENADRYGAAVGNVAAGKFETLTKLCELARSDDTAALFDARFAPSGSAAKESKEVRNDIAALLQHELGGDYRPEIVHRFLRHFVMVRFDYLHEGAVDSPEAINAVRAALPLASAATDASALWSALCQIAREEATRAAQFSRPSLVCRLGRRVRLIGAPSLRSDLAKLAHLAADWVQDIEDSVRGTRLAREALSRALDAALAQERFVQVRGLPGSGKSVLLRRRIETDLQNGPVLFLKSERLEGKSWSSFANAVGLSDAPLSDLLVELAAVNTAVLYIDGIDRIEKDHQGVVADLVRQILTNPLLEDWHIVISLRDAGSEPLRTWLPDLFTKGRLGTVEVRLLDDDEARALAESQPALSPLLFGSEPVKEIVRRPFFAKILSYALTSSASAAGFTPVSEVDLIENWWARGGFNTGGSAAILRQRALVELAALRVRDLSQPLALAAMSTGTVALLEEFVSDGILQVVRAGHSVRFAHDIFFEWALCHQLVDRGEGWLEEIRDAGEPPLAGRVIELLSQADFVADRGWDKTLARLEASDLRSQWTRAWLLGPVFAPTFDYHRERYFAIAARDNHRLLGKALVWFQAEKTVPNAAILEGRIGSATLKGHEIVRLADTMGWPSDYAAWRRLITLVLDHIADIPVALIPDVVMVFEVWQNALAELRNAVSQRLLAQCAIWLKTIEQRRHRRWRRLSDLGPRGASRWDDFDGGDLEESLRALVLRGVQVRPDLVTEYLTDLKANKHRLDKVFKGVVLYAPFLVRGHAASLADISLLYFREELPEDHIRHEREEQRRVHEQRRRAKAKPENERTREDELILNGPFSILGSSFNSYEWDRLAVDRDQGDYFPASPLREPFNSLFQAAPGEALRLVKGVSNHAMLAWRQLHAVDPHCALRKPIPIVIDFPWGQQEFWGTGREYLWYRGLWAPKPLTGAYQAMERWALASLDAGRTVDEVIAEVVNGHDCVAALGIAVSLALKSQVVTPAAAALVRCQRLWRYDLERMVQDRSMDSIGAIGWRGAYDHPHYEALKALNDLPHRKLWLRDLVGQFLLSADHTLAEQTRAAIAGFPTDLPYQYEEQRADPDFAAALLEDAQFNAEFANPNNVKTATVITEEHGEAEVTYIDNPQTRDPKVRKQLADANESAQIHTLWFWADRSLKETTMADEIACDQALIFAKRIDGRDLFKNGRNERVERTMHQGALAAMAAVVLKYRPSFNAKDVAWARKVLKLAAQAPEIADGMWSSGAVIPWHPAISVAKAMGFEIAAGEAVDTSKHQLLRLIAHPLDGVALEALQQCLALWESDARFAWCALWEALALCQFTTSPREASARMYDPAYIASKKLARAEEAIAYFQKKDFWPALPAMPPAWVEVESARPEVPSFIPDVEEIDDDGDVAVNPRQWRQPDTVFDWNFAAKVLALAPVAAVFAHAETRQHFLDFARALLGWVLDKMAPPWKKPGRRERNQHLGHLDDAVGNLFARLAIALDSKAFSDLFFEPVFALENELCYDLLSPFLNMYVCIAIYDAKTIPANAVATIESCLQRVLKDRVFDPKDYRAGELYGHDLPYMMRSFLFVSAENAGGAARFANGDWSDISLVMPIVDRLVRAAGWAWSVMHDYLTLVERARDVYPAETFADQVLVGLSGERESLKGWRGLYLPARIAGLVQFFAFRDCPLPAAVAQKLLRILDILVDMGDRRSAALQISDPFREVRRRT